MDMNSFLNTVLIFHLRRSFKPKPKHECVRKIFCEPRIMKVFPCSTMKTDRVMTKCHNLSYFLNWWRHRSRHEYEHMTCTTTYPHLYTWYLTTYNLHICIPSVWCMWCHLFNCSSVITLIEGRSNRTLLAGIIFTHGKGGCYFAYCLDLDRVNGGDNS